MAPRARVLSFISQWGGGAPRSPTTATPTDDAVSSIPPSPQKVPPSMTSADVSESIPREQTPTSPQHRHTRSADTFSSYGASSRPMSMIQTYHPPVMEVAKDTLPELMPIFTYLNSHSTKLYQEGYFLMLHDLDTRGRPSPSRQWTEVFAQLVGTVVSIWDAAQLDVAGNDGEVIPTFINLADASIKMIPSLPMTGTGASGQTLQNVLSISTAANNRYLLHFNSLNSLTQWTSGIRLCMYEHTTLQEAYTGSLIAGKGKTLNNIRDIMERTRMKHEDWARVRFGAGTPWRRCWCVVNPPDEKEYAKLQKSLKKRGPYDKSTPILKGDIKFYESKKITKKTRPIATITDAFSAYAIYPQTKALIDQSTLVKIEGQITIHSKPESTTEGFVFIMPEAHAAVTGFEIMMRFLFPVFDTFALYGRPQRLVAEPLDTRGLMFAMPKDRRYGYLELLDVGGLIHADGANTWSERQWRKQLKDLTSQRMTSAPSRTDSRSTRNRSSTLSRVSLQQPKGSVRFNDSGVAYSQPSSRRSSPSHDEEPVVGPQRVDSAPPVSYTGPRHQRSMSENQHNNKRFQVADRGSFDAPPRYMEKSESQASIPDGYETGEEGQISSEPHIPPELTTAAKGTLVPDGVEAPPPFKHNPTQKPALYPQASLELRRANSNVDTATLQQLADATNATISPSVAAAGAAWKTSSEGRRSGEHDRSQRLHSDQRAYTQDQLGPRNMRLPTIPASPYIEQGDPTEKAAPYEPSAPAVPEHGIPQEYQDISNVNPLGLSNEGLEIVEDPSQRPGSSPGVARKPVPGRSKHNAEVDNPSSPTSSSLNSLRNHVIDPEALDRFVNRERVLARVQSHSSSNYDDQSRNSTDYASTDHASVRSIPRKAVLPVRDYDRPRAGVLKTVGNVEKGPVIVGDIEYSTKPKKDDDLGMPVIDFGPTHAIHPENKTQPGAGDAHNRSRSRSQERLGAMVTPGYEDSNRASYFGSPSPRPSPNGSDTGQDSKRNSVWQPVMGTPPLGHQSRVSLSAEDWVQQRAIAANQPLQPRAPSGLTHHRPAGTPPANRSPSGDWTQNAVGHQRTPPLERAQARPHSRGASVMLNPQHLISADSPQLSAREQEFVARTTGTPLLQVGPKKEKLQRPKSAGLIGAIEAREKEKRNLQNHGSGGALVQNAIYQRQQQAAAQQHMRQSSLGNMNMQMQQSMGISPGMPMGVPMMQPQQYSPQLMAPFSMQQQQQQGSPSMYQLPNHSQGYFPSPQQMPPSGYAQSVHGRFSPQPPPQQFQGGGPATFTSQQAQPKPYGASWDAQQAQQQNRFYGRR